MTPVTNWDAVLDDFEARLADQWAALRAGSLDGAQAFAPPPVDGPLPPEHVERATALVWRCRELEDALAAALAAATENLERLDRAAPAVPAGPVYFDSRV
jgi:hypothetical protein